MRTTSQRVALRLLAVLCLLGAGPRGCEHRDLASEVRIVRLGEATGHAELPGGVRPVLGSDEVELAGLAGGRLLLAAARPEGGEARCRATLVTAAGETRLADFPLTGGARRWTDVEATLPEVTTGRLRLGCTGEGLAEAPVAWARPLLAPAARAKPSPLIVLLSLDTLRADHVPGFGADEALSPSLARLAAEGTRFPNAQAESTWTLPSHYALMTSRIFGMEGSPRLPDGLAGALAAAGWVTVAATGGGWVSPRWGFHEGFDHYAGRFDAEADAWEMVGEAVALLDRLGDVPTFLFLHTYAVHRSAPAFQAWRKQRDSPAEPYPADAEQLAADAAHYARLVREMDPALETLFARLRREAARRPVLLVALSDHGEAFGEHDDYGHGMVSPRVTLHDEIVRIPLIVWGPGLVPAGQASSRPVALVDVAPSILAAAGVPTPAWMRGADLWSLWSRRGPPPADGTGAVTHLEGAWAYRTERHKLIVRMAPEGRDAFQLYDLRADPEERTDLAASEPERVAALAAGLKRRLAALGIPPPLEAERYAFPRGSCEVYPRWLRCDPAAGEEALAGGERRLEIRSELREQLEALGYYFE